MNTSDPYQMELDSWRDRCARLEAAYDKTQLPDWVRELFWVIGLAALGIGYVVARHLLGVENHVLRLVVAISFVWLTCKLFSSLLIRRRRKAYRAMMNVLYEMPFRTDGGLPL